MDASQLIYLYDLPKDEISCNKIAITFKEKSGVILDSKPQIKRDITRPFYTAMVSIKDTKQFEEACEKMKYFEIDGKQCRALPFDKQLLGSNKDKLHNHNIFVKVPKDVKHEDLHSMFEQSGKIKSLKVSLNPDYSSRGYGFICFQEEQGAVNALSASVAEGIHQMKFEPKDRRQLRRLINNIYVKNIPHEKSQNDIVELFKPFGNIKSLVLQSNQIGQFAFICYDDPNNQNKEYGPECAQKAIDAMNDKEIATGVKLCVKHALKKAEREIEKVRETIRYKASKKRCNLYVKNFPNQWTKENLTDLFKNYGEIENIRLEKGRTGNAFAFVCYKEPTDAAKAKQNLQNHACEGKMLIINYYEIKEVRKLQMEEAKDKADWEKYQASQTGGLKWNDLPSQPHLAQMLQQLLGIIQYNEQAHQQINQGENRMRAGGRKPYRDHRGGGPHGGYGQQHNNMDQMRGMQQMPGHQQMPGQPMPGQMPGGHHNRMPPPQHQQQPVPQHTQPPHPGAAAQPGMPMQPQMPAQPNMQNMQNMTPGQRYVMATAKFIPAVTERNPHMKEQVGQCIFDFIQMLVGPEKAPKITGMLIELPVQQIKTYMGSFEALQMKVKEAHDHLMQAQMVGQPQQDPSGQQ